MHASAKAGLSVSRTHSQMLALEPRYLFDAAAVATVADTTSDTSGSDTGSADSQSATSAQDSTQENAAAFLTEVNAASNDADLAPDKQSFFIPENAAEGSRAGFIATNPGVGEVTFTVTGGNGEEAFAVKPDTGEIIIKDSSKIDFESLDGTGKLTIDVLISSGDNGQEQVEAEVFIGNVNDPPVVEPVENQIATVGDTLTVQIVAHDPDGDQIFYQLRNAPEGASIDADGLFTWTPAPDQETDSATTISIYVSDGTLGTSTTTLVDFDFVIERVNPVNDTNNGDPSRSGETFGDLAATPSSSEQLIDDSTAEDIISRTVTRDMAISDARADVDLLLLEIAEIESYGLEDMSRIDTEVDQVQALIAEGNDPTQLTPSTAAGFSKQVSQEAQGQDADMAEIIAIMEEATALLGCNR